MLRHGVERCMQLGQSQQWAEDRYGEIGSGDAEQMIDAATEIVKALKARGDDAFADWLKDSVGGLRVTSPDVPKALLDLDVPVVTTNYDTLLEQAKKARLGGPHRPPATWLEHYRVLEVLRRREDSVAHLHGCWKDPLSVVLDRESYAKIGKHEGFQYIAQAAWGLLPLLFVGVGEGMGDPNFRRLWSAIGEVWGKRDIGSRFWLRCEYERSWSAAQEESLSDRVQVVEYG
ncbi:MAG TPA: SIR2 family protein, partial [Acidimicrobiales bacterium]|nr:SIR2 family protein [Acidimicrobiales bacterium]